MKVRTLMMLMVLLLLPLQARAQAIKGQIVQVGFAGNYRPGAWVPVRVVLQNRSGKNFEGRLAVEQPDLDGDRVLTMGQPFVLSPEDDARALWAYFWPRPDDELNENLSVLVLDKSGNVISTVTMDSATRAAMERIAPTGGVQERSCRLVTILGDDMGWGNFNGMYGGTEEVRRAVLSSPAMLPDDVRGYDGLDVLVWEADNVNAKAHEVQNLNAVLAWVKSGGHLIISVSTEIAPLLDPNGPMLAAMPMQLTGTRPVPADALRDFPGCAALHDNQTMLIQAIGMPRPDARILPGGAYGPFAENPLLVTGPFGRGAVTLLTINPNNTAMAGKMKDADWVRFWDAVAGWQAGTVVTPLDIKKETVSYDQPRTIAFAPKLTADVDVSEVTEIRTAVAVLFLIGYWLLAGPLGYLVLRHYQVVHWSWWIFGGTVLVATTIAGVVVFSLHVANTDVRHKSFVVGVVNQPEASVLGFYGVYAPQSGPVELKIPESAGEMDYLAPMSIPDEDQVKGYADPQHYDMSLEHPNVISPIFRTTLKKMQARWTGARPGIDGTAAYTEDAFKSLKGDLVNNTGYDLEDVKIAVFEGKGSAKAEAFPTTPEIGYVHLYVGAMEKGTWKKGQHLLLEKQLALDRVFPLAPPGTPPSIGTLDYTLEMSVWSGLLGDKGLGRLGRSSVDTGSLETDWGTSVYYSHQTMEDVMQVLCDVRRPDLLGDQLTNLHCEPERGILRLMDCTKLLHACGAVIIAHAGNIAKSEFVESPVPMSVAGNVIPGKGEVLFAYALPVEGTPPERVANRSLGHDPLAPAPGRPGVRGGMLIPTGVPPAPGLPDIPP